MLKRLSIIGPSAGLKDIIFAGRQIKNQARAAEFARNLSEFTGAEYLYLTDSGIASFYIILEILKKFSGRKEVVVPAYTAGSLVIAIKKAGLKPVLCDISLESFNLDRGRLFAAVSVNTLAVACVHMFGIGLGYIGQLREGLGQDIFIIEDCAQAMGARVKNQPIGSFGDLGFFSFNRGKNLPIYSGGCLFTNRQSLALEILRMFDLKGTSLNLKDNLFSLLKVSAFSLALNPWIYSLFYPLACGFRSTTVADDFKVAKMPNFQAILGLSLSRRKEEFFRLRYLNGMSLIKMLRGIGGIALPVIPETDQPVFSRFPVIFEDAGRISKVEKKLWQVGLETSRMYLKPLSRMFDLGYQAKEFANADYFAGHLLTLPVHPLVRGEDLAKMAEIIRSVK